MKSKDLLNKLFIEIETVILSRQHPVTGLLPASTAVNAHGDYTDAWVRDNVYSIVCVWALGLAYRRKGEKVRSDHLEQSTIKLMRGLLQSMMRQADKVEKFKHTLNPIDSLHAKYDTATGLPVVADDAWGHLQIDATSLFLLMLGQMSASGLRIIFTNDEVDFVQNLIYYIASAYRTPDFGIWERGNKINNGKTEINASSLGMAKAALQGLDGFNLFGKNASPRGVVHTVADAISNARATLASLLPRESLSKEVDSAILSVIGFPAFAVGDEALVNKTRDKILAELGGNYGCKRFIWDGHQTELEDSSRLYYEHTELVNFENIESEWPLFYTFLYVDALFNYNDATAKHYREKIEKLMVEVDGHGLIPELYYLPHENIAAEKKAPRSQERVPNENIPLVWAQSLYLTGLMIDEDLLTPDDLDKLKVRRRSTRFVQPQIALVVLAENEHVKNVLVDNGVIAESVDDIRPIGVISAPHLVEAYAQVGANDALGLSGRPPRQLQSLSTSQTYDINGDQFLCLSWLQGDQDDYRNFDAKRIAYKIEQEISHIRKHWLNTEVAVFTFMVEQRSCDSPDAGTLFQTLRDLQLKTNNDRVGYASAKLAYRASRTNSFVIPNLCITPIDYSQLYRGESLLDSAPEGLCQEAKDFIAAYKQKPVLERALADKANYDLVAGLCRQLSIENSLGAQADNPLEGLIELVYRIACEDNHWMTARYCYHVLGKAQNVLADGLILLESRHLRVVIGSRETQHLCMEGTPSDKDVVNKINQVSDSALESTLTQEVLAITGSLTRTNPNLFDGIRSIYVHNLLSLCAGDDAEAILDAEKTEGALNLVDLASLSPSAFLNRLLGILQVQQKIFTKGIDLDYSQGDDQRDLLSTEVEQVHAMDTDWLEWRSARGLIPRFDEKFLKDVWQSLAFTSVIVFGDEGSEECSLNCELARRSMTPGEESFARLIDQYAQQVHPPYYKSAILETLHAFSIYCEQHPQSKFGVSLNLGSVLEKAAALYVGKDDKRDALSRNLDAFIELSPYVVQRHLASALAFFERSKKGVV